MAIINSMGVGRARKSMGNVTYRTVRGRTIGSQKITSSGEGTRAPGQAQQQFVFGFISRYATMHAASIKLSFNRTKYGSERNYFAKVNNAGLTAAALSIYNGGQSIADITDAVIEATVTAYATDNPTSIYRVRKSGVETVYLSGAWDNEPDPEPTEPAITSFSINGESFANSEDSFPVLRGGDNVILQGGQLDVSEVKIRIYGGNQPGTHNIGDILAVGTITSTRIEGTALAPLTESRVDQLILNGQVVWQFGYVDPEV